MNTRKPEPPRRARPQKADPEFAPQEIVVTNENHISTRQTIVQPSPLVLKQDTPLPNLIASTAIPGAPDGDEPSHAGASGKCSADRRARAAGGAEQAETSAVSACRPAGSGCSCRSASQPSRDADSAPGRRHRRSTCARRHSAQARRSSASRAGASAGGRARARGSRKPHAAIYSFASKRAAGCAACSCSGQPKPWPAWIAVFKRSGCAACAACG